MLKTSLAALLCLFTASPAEASLFPVPLQAQETPAKTSSAARERISERCLELLWGLHEEREFPGGVAALILPDGVSISLPVGFADPEQELEMTPQARMLSGSIGKTYVSAAAHKLMLAGKLDFDERASKYLADAPWFERVPNAQSITVRQLLRHQSGIARHIFKPDFLPACYSEPDKVWKPEELLSYIFDDDAMFPAGEGWAYADTNYIVLGMVIEQLAGMSFYDYVQQEFLEPLELSNTVPSDRRRIPGLVQGHITTFRQAGVPERSLEDGVFFFNPQFEWTGGGYASSAMDLARWAHLLYGGRAMEGDYLGTMLEDVPARLGPGKSYGHGVIMTKTPLGLEAGHDGIMVGYTATVGHLLEHGLTVCLMLNTDDQAALGQPRDRVARQLAEIALEELGR